MLKSKLFINEMRSTNWSKLRSSISVTEKKRHRKDHVTIGGSGGTAASSNKANTIDKNHRELDQQNSGGSGNGSSKVNNNSSSSSSSGFKLSKDIKAKYVGIDCEMVGIGPEGKQSALARVSIVDFDGNILYDEYVRPPSYVTDFRTQWSGIRKKDLRQGSALTLAECQQSVAALMKDKIIVGHALRNDLDVLMLSHPRQMIRDTATYRPYMRSHGKHGKWRPRSLKDLSKQHLKKDIQSGEHDPAEDARCAMMLYILARDHWEKDLKERKHAARSRTDAALKSGATAATAAVADDDDGENIIEDSHAQLDGSVIGGGGSGNDEKIIDDSEDGNTTTMIINYKETSKQSPHYTYSATANGGGGVLKARATIDVEVEVIGNRSSGRMNGHVMSINGTKAAGGCDDNDDIDDDNDNDGNDMVDDGIQKSSSSSSSSSKQQVLNRSKKRKVSSRGMVNVVPKNRRKFLESKSYAEGSRGSGVSSASAAASHSLVVVDDGGKAHSRGMSSKNTTTTTTTTKDRKVKSSMYGGDTTAAGMITGSNRGGILSIHTIDRRMAKSKGL